MSGTLVLKRSHVRYFGLKRSHVRDSGTKAVSWYQSGLMSGTLVLKRSHVRRWVPGDWEASGKPRISLRGRYAGPGTDAEYGGTRLMLEMREGARGELQVLPIRIALCAR
eukprot:1405989-Rhodomonas_salina.3